MTVSQEKALLKYSWYFMYPLYLIRKRFFFDSWYLEFHSLLVNSTIICFLFMNPLFPCCQFVQYSIPPGCYGLLSCNVIKCGHFVGGKSVLWHQGHNGSGWCQCNVAMMNLWNVIEGSHRGGEKSLPGGWWYNTPVLSGYPCLKVDTLQSTSWLVSKNIFELQSAKFFIWEWTEKRVFWQIDS